MKTTDPIQQAFTLATELLAMLGRIEEVTSQLQPVKVKPNNRPKLTKGDVRRVFIMRRNGCTIADIAECFDVNRSTISRTLRGVYNS